jgi:hypothetical protein
MSDSENGKHRVFESMDAFTRMWSEFATKAMSAGMAATPGSTPPEAARQMRAAMLKAMSEQCEQFMRSPAFLEMMKQSLDAAVTLRTQVNAFLNRAHHEMQGVARDDVDSLMLTIRHFESRVLDRLEAMEQRLDDLAALTGEPVSKSTKKHSTKKRR